LSCSPIHCNLEPEKVGLSQFIHPALRLAPSAYEKRNKAMEKRVVIVDYDCLSSLGTDVNDTWTAASTNRSGVRDIDRYVPAENRLQGVPDIAYAGQIPISFEELAGSADRYEKWPEPGYHAAKLLAGRIFGRIGFDVSRHDPQRIGVLGGTALTSEISQDIVTRTGKPDTKFILHQCHNTPLAAVASDFGLQGPSFSVSSACASSGHALFLAGQLIKAGVIDAALVTGFEFPVLPVCVGGFEWMKALYRRDNPDDRAYGNPAAASRPFSGDRRGFVLAEGAGAALVACASYAEVHAWPVQAVLRGGYVNSDGGHLTRISRENIARCIRGALADAGRVPEMVECVNAHATSTPLGDESEMRALHEVFGDHLRRAPIVANKSQIGHALGASFILAMILAAEGMKHGVILPTLNYLPDARLPDALVPTQASKHEHAVTLLNSFGFGGTNVSLVLERSLQ
jgi:3-oxoacyl-[acyl-carrier-protein] synthase II